MEDEKLITIKEAKKSPCENCRSTLCCQLLMITKYPLLSLLDLDWTRYYLNLNDITVILDRSGECTVYYSKLCKFLDNVNNKCLIHNQLNQPSICFYYNPYQCFYKKLMEDKLNIRNGSIWLDHARLNYLSEQIGFDEKRNIIQMPDCGELVNVFNSLIPYNRNADPTLTKKRESVFVRNESICFNCLKLCCRQMLIRVNKPLNIGNLDFYAYSMNFPGIQYLISDDRWIMVVDAKCKYLNEMNECSIENINERPLRCRYLNPMQCNMNYEINRSDQIKVDFSNFDKIRKGIKINEKGEVIFIESVENMKKDI